MSIEVRPFGVKCNIECSYCYQNPVRGAGNIPNNYDLSEIKRAIEKEGGDFILFGGEPLLMPLRDLEDLWSWGFVRFKKNGLQTNGILITDDHVRLFTLYNVHVGISVDGPDELNSLRWGGSPSATIDATAKTHAAIESLCKKGIVPSLIVTLHRANATEDKLPKMHAWIRKMDELGIKSVRLHVLEIDHPNIRAQFALSTQENVAAFVSFIELENELKNLRFDIAKDMRALMVGQDNHTTCIWNACDPYTTRAVRGIEGRGQRSNCGRTNKDGIDFLKAAVPGYERYVALYNTPQECGGCHGCRFFLACKGQCPGTAIDGDWRNRTEHCDLWKTLYRRLEKEMVQNGETPLSIHPKRLQIEKALLQEWQLGHNPTIQNVMAACESSDSQSSNEIVTDKISILHGDMHGDHYY